VPARREVDIRGYVDRHLRCRLVIGGVTWLYDDHRLLITVVGLAIAGRRPWWLFRLISSGQPGPAGWTTSRAVASRPRRCPASASCSSGRCRQIAHFFTMWGFFHPHLHHHRAWARCSTATSPSRGSAHRLAGFLEDFFAVAVLARHSSPSPSSGCANAPRAPAARVPVLRLAHRSRLAGVAMISSVIVSLLIYRAAQINTGHCRCREHSRRASPRGWSPRSSPHW